MGPHLNEKEILDYLMTSDFNEGLTHEESRFLLMKFRNHYRLLYGKAESLGRERQEMSEKISDLNEKVGKLSQQVEIERGRLRAETERPLTLKERLTGKKTKPKDGS
jgi:hypothetical protein